MLNVPAHHLLLRQPHATGRIQGVLPCRNSHSSLINGNWGCRARVSLCTRPSLCKAVLEEPPLTPVGLPERRFQRPLDMNEIKARRTQSNELASDKKIQRITVGQNGLTRTFLGACMDVLCNHELLRVKLGEGCGLDREETAEYLESHLDAVAVFKVGYTITLFRERGLPRPSNLPDVVREMHLAEQRAKGIKVPLTEEEIVESKKARDEAKAKGRTSSASLARVQAAKLAAKKRPKGPPAFEVL